MIIKSQEITYWKRQAFYFEQESKELRVILSLLKVISTEISLAQVTSNKKAKSRKDINISEIKMFLAEWKWYSFS